MSSHVATVGTGRFRRKRRLFNMGEMVSSKIRPGGLAASSRLRSGQRVLASSMGIKTEWSRWMGIARMSHDEATCLRISMHLATSLDCCVSIHPGCISIFSPGLLRAKAGLGASLCPGFSAHVLAPFTSSPGANGRAEKGAGWAPIPFYLLQLAGLPCRAGSKHFGQ